MERKVLFSASTYSHIINFHLPYLKEFRRLGWTVHAACGGEPRKIPEAQRLIHIPFEKSMTSPHNFSAAALLRRVIRQENYTLISCHTSLASFFVRLAVLGMRHRPLVACTSHGYLFDDCSPKLKQLLLAGAEQLVAPVTDLLMTMNAWDDEFAFEHQLGKQVVKIPGMGVDFSHMTYYSIQEGNFLRQSLGFSQESFLLIYAAEFSKRKSQKDLIRAMSSLPDHIGLLLPGEGTLRDECIHLAEHLGVSHRIAFPGQVYNMPLWYAAADAAVSSSRSEGLPFNIMEAMYYGLPVVASDVKGNSDLIQDGKNGFLFPYGDSSACAAQIKRLAQNRMLAQKLGEKAKLSVQPYALSNVLPQVMSQYEALLPLQAAENLASVSAAAKYKNQQ